MSIYKNSWVYFICLFITFSSCSKPPTDTDTVDEEEIIEISEFYFSADKNPSLSADLILTLQNDLYSGNVKKLFAKNLIPTFKSNAQKVLVDGIEQVSGVTVRDFSQPVKYSFVGAKGTKKEITVQLTLTNNITIPHMYVEIDNQEEVVEKEKYLNGTVSILGKDLYSDFYAPTEIRGRGNSTWQQPKKPYRLRLKTKASVLGLPEARNWVLLANFLDPSLMCNAVAMRIGRDLKVPFTNDIIPVDLTINGNYKGSYVLTQHLEVADNRINVTKEGYLFELDTYYDEEFKFRSTNYNLPVMIKSPDLKEQSEVAPIKADFEKLENLISSSNFPDNGYRDKLDINVFAKYLLVYILTGNEELNHPKSTYIHKVPNGKYSFGPIWDFDWAYGFEGAGNHFTNPGRAFFWSNNNIGSRFFQRLLEDTEVKKAFKTHWQNYKTNHFAQLMTFIDEYAEMINESKAKDEQIWKKGKDFAQEVGRLKAYLNARSSYIDNMVTSY
ncbi:CotH kinase family protein [Sphingobacterium litopenaei]|uniref:CotH kinase family protein n=1 Tax=Sphingobacterium litopenaei TaxID=2763500 RepID=A0ABR7YHL4_9SPHI|nr:CotH kinase family protein [Sphingobacterium litopenaei]MBD1430811.1 CotH kinase family protein [Sphingobacterium litopenaei]